MKGVLHAPPALIFSISRKREKEGKESARKRDLFSAKSSDHETITLKSCQSKTSCDGVANRSHGTLSPSPAGIREATEGKREWDSPSAMLKPCARVLAFNPTVYRLATDTLVSPSPAPVPLSLYIPLYVHQPPLPRCARDDFTYPSTLRIHIPMPSRSLYP